MPALDDYQLEDAVKMASAKRYALFYEMRTGKTAPAIHAVKLIGARRTLVICPASCKRNWMRELEMWYPSAPRRILEGDAAKRADLMTEFQKEEGFLVGNYEQFLWVSKDMAEKAKKRNPNSDVTEGPSPELETLLKRPPDCLIIDESKRLKNRKSQFFEGMNRLALRCPALFELEGTPVLNEFADLWGQLHILAPKKFSSYWNFMKEYGGYDYLRDRNPYGYAVMPRKAKYPAKLMRDIAPHSSRRLYTETRPGDQKASYEERWVELKPRERKLYEKMEADGIAKLESGERVTAPVAIAMVTRLMQFSISPDLAIIEGKPPAEINARSIQTAKFDELREIIESIGEDEKFLIFSQWTRCLTLVGLALDAAGVPYVKHTGEETQKERDANLTRFKETPASEVKGCLLTITSGGVGLDITVANYVIRMDKHWTPAINEQAVFRCLGRNQTRPVTVIDILASDTIEEDKELLLAEKEELAAAIVRAAKRRRKAA